MAELKTMYQRLPEIYRLKDAEQTPPYQLKAMVDLLEEQVFDPLKKNMDDLYHNLFIETCDEWVIPYIGDLLGTTHLQGEAWTRRADVADTIALRRRKGTVSAIERLTYDLTKWGVHVKELRNNLGWMQHLNHQRPDEGGQPPYDNTDSDDMPPKVAFGGMVDLKDPSMVSLIDTPFDPYGHTADLKKAAFGQLRTNLPNLGIFLWRLKDYQIPISAPLLDHQFSYQYKSDAVADPIDVTALCFHVDPCGKPITLFNAHQYDPSEDLFKVTSVDDVPGVMHRARLTTRATTGCPEKYLNVETYNPDDWSLDDIALTDVGLQFHLPREHFADTGRWEFIGTDLSDWENGLSRVLTKDEIAVDPALGRIMIPVTNEDQKNDLMKHLLLTYTYGAPGPVGAHPVSRDAVTETVAINFHDDPQGLQKELDGIQDLENPKIIEIQDSMVHELDVTGLDGILNQDGGLNIQLKHSLTIRAASGERPVIRLHQPLRFRPTYVASMKPDGTEEETEEKEKEQAYFEGLMSKLNVRLEGLFLTRADSFPAGQPLIARTGLNRLELTGCTLDPEGERNSDGNRNPVLCSALLKKNQGFIGNEQTCFKQTPQIMLDRTISGPLLMDSDYSLYLTDSIIDAGKGLLEEMDGVAQDFAVASATTPLTSWGPRTQIQNATLFGSMRVERLCGRGGIWVHPLLVENNQTGCIKYSYFPAEGNRLPQHHACWFGDEVDLRFTGEAGNDPGYGQLSFITDYKVREQGPNEDHAGAYNFLLEAHKWRNLKIRYREFMPVGVRPLLIPVT